MYKILLACAGGMSTGMLVKKMEEEARHRDIEVSIEAVAESRVQDLIDLYDIVLLGPQITYLEAEFNEQFADKGKPIVVIDLTDYGMLNGAAVLDRAIALIGENKDDE